MSSSNPWHTLHKRWCNSAAAPLNSPIRSTTREVTMSLTRYRHSLKHIYWVSNGVVMGYKEDRGKRVYFGGWAEDVPRRALF